VPRRPTTARASGTVITTPLGGGPVLFEDTVQCVHCMRHMVVRDGVRFGYCQRCGGHHCPTVRCSVCVPAEQWLENVEGGRPEDHRPGRVLVPPGVPRE
jgi:hypothetical protein